MSLHCILELNHKFESMDALKQCIFLSFLLLLLVNIASAPLLPLAQAADVSVIKEDKQPVYTGREIIEHCIVEKTPGLDQQSILTVLLRTPDSKIKKSIYHRFWKDFKGVDGVVDKMLLFAEFPPDAKGSAFMRASYLPELNKPADQWIYLPLLRKIRRVSIRDMGDRFLNSDLTYEDISSRNMDDDNYKFLGIQQVQNMLFFMVESIPIKGSSQYTKRQMWFTKTVDWDGCVHVRTDYYDNKGDLLKQQFIKWQQIKDAWVWDRVLVRNRQNGHGSIFMVSDVKVNTGLKDEFFEARTMAKGLDSLTATPAMEDQPR